MKPPTSDDDDATDRRAIDPTKNVIALVEANRQASELLRSADVKFNDAQNTHLKELIDADRRHAAELREAEAKRIDSIRQVDVAATKTEADRALQAIQTLAQTSKTDAENIRVAVNTTADTIAKQNAETLREITTRIAALEKAQYEGVGKQQVVDPMMAGFMTEVKTLLAAQAAGVGKSAGVNWVIVTAATSISMLTGLMGIAAVLYAVLKH